MSSLSKTVFIDKLGDIVNKYNNTYHSTMKMKPSDVKSNTNIDSSKKINDKNLNLKLVILLEYQNITIFWQMTTLQIELKTFLWSQNLKILWHVFNYLNEKEIVENFHKKVLQKKKSKRIYNWKTNQEKIR